MSFFLHTLSLGLFTGLLTGGIYALMACGLTLTYGVMRVINVAQGILVILGAYLSYALENLLRLDLFVGLLFSMPALFGVGVFIQWALLRRLKGNRTALSLLVLFAVAQIIEGTLSWVFTTDSVHLHSWAIDTSFPVPIPGGGVYYVAVISILACVLSVLLLSGLFLLVYRTPFGFGLRASMQHPEVALLIGIDVGWVQRVTFGIGVALSAAGGMAYGAIHAFNPASSYDLISRLLVIIVLGGMGSLRGTLLASVLMLVIGNVTALVWSPIWSTTAFCVALMILLILRPQGLAGLTEGRQL